MIDALKSWIPIVAVAIAFALGTFYGTARTEKAWKEADNAALIEYQEKAQKVLEAKDAEIKRLNADLSHMSQSRADSVRKLAKYQSRERTLTECQNDRARMAELAVGLDDFAQRLVIRTRSMIE